MVSFLNPVTLKSTASQSCHAQVPPCKSSTSVNQTIKALSLSPDPVYHSSHQSPKMSLRKRMLEEDLDDETPSKVLVDFFKSVHMENFIERAPPEVLIKIYFMAGDENIVETKYQHAISEISEINSEFYDVLDIAHDSIEGEDEEGVCRRINMMATWFTIIVGDKIRRLRRYNDKFINYDDLISEHKNNMAPLEERLENISDT